MSKGQEYNISIYGKHVQATDAIKNYILDKFSKIEKMAPGIIDVHVKLEVHKLEHLASITMKFSHFLINAHAVTTDLYASIDEAMHRLFKKVRRWKTKIQSHHNRGQKMVEMPVAIFEKEESEVEETTDEINEAIEGVSVEEISTLPIPKIAKSKLRALKNLTLQEAILKMELSDDNFLVYRSEEDQKLKVLYRRRDKSYGLLQPE